jgi:DNA-directed RNA polymerase subunit L
MEITIIKDDKNDLEIEVDNQTIAELVRVYLNKDSAVKLGAWKKPHYSKPFVIKVKTEGKSAKKAFQDAVALAQKDLSKYKEEFKKAK